MKSFILFLMAVFLVVPNVPAQKIFSTRNARINFASPTDNDVKAVNNEVTSRIADNGQITFSLLVKGFRFALAEMQDHFNDQYLESNKFPRADFKGNITNLTDINFNKDGIYKVVVNGSLTLHGITRNITANGTIEIKDGKPVASCKFFIAMKDFNVDASKVTEKVIAEVNCQYQ